MGTGIFLAFAFAIAVAGGLYFMATGLGRSKLGGRARPSKVPIRKYARRFLKRFPGTKPPGLREALRQEFLPEWKSNTRDDDRAFVGGMLFGLTGWYSVKAVESGMLAASDADRKEIEKQINEVVEEVFEEDD